MRQVTKATTTAFMERKPAQVNNTRTDGDTLFLHENAIARHVGNGVIRVTLAGWNTSTTRDRLNALPGVSVNFKGGQAYLNGQPWNGQWTDVVLP